MIFLKKYLLISCLSIVIIILTKHYLEINKLLYNSLLTNFTTKEIENYFQAKAKWEWVSNIFVFIYIYIKIIIITSILYIGCSFFSKTNIKFNKIMLIVTEAEFIFLIALILKPVWFYFFETKYTLEDVQRFYPLSVLNITGYKNLDPWLFYPLQTLNLFEVVYIIYLSYQIGSLTKTNADNGLKIVGYSYVPALLLWVTVVMFFTLNYS